MLYRFRGVFFTVLVLLSFLPLNLSLAQTVTVPDPNLAAAIRAVIGDSITEASMLNLTRLDVTNLGITDLTGLEHAQNLTILGADYNSISDVSPLSGLTKLTFLSFSGNDISDISHLSRLTELTILDLQNNNISDISALAELTKLTTLFISNNSISDISALAGLTELRDLNLAPNSISDISALAELTKLTHLELGNNDISNISHLSRLTELTYLGLRDNDISDISALTGLTELWDLNLAFNSISNVSPLARLTKLTILGLGVNNISDVSSLTGLTNLTDLYLARNDISDISSLSGLTNLTLLSLEGTSISDISPLSGLTKLSILYLGNNDISDISSLSGLTNLTELDLHDNSISDISSLSGLTNLTQLYLYDNSISDVSPLTGLTQLRRLSIGNNNISDVSPLVALELTGFPGYPTGLFLVGNPLNYASINTHIPAMQAKGVTVSFTDRTPTFLNSVSGTGQVGIVNTALADPFVVVVLDQQRHAFEGVPVTWTITSGKGTLSVPTTTANANGNAETRLTFGATPGTTTVSVTAAEISQPVEFTATANPVNIALITFNPPTIADQTFVVSRGIMPLVLPQATGGIAPYTYTLSPIPEGLIFEASTRTLSGTPTTPAPATDATYTATDAADTSASLTFIITVELNLDVNADGKVDILDLVWVAVSYQMRGDGLPADVNADGVVNVQDLVAVANGIDAAAVLPAKVAEEVALAAEAAAAKLAGAAGAPGMPFSSRSEAVSGLTAHRNVAAALSDVRSLAGNDVRLSQYMPLLEELLQTLSEIRAIPETTALLPNYPNPFNPETWIPYHLATDAEVTLTIYDVRGSVVRELTLGHQPAGVYESRGRAAYWDGKNQLGEPVASGLYFYTLSTASTRDSVKAGDFNATGKMLIAK